MEKIITSILPSFDELQKQILVFVKAHPDWNLSDQCKFFNEKYKANIYDDEFFTIIWNTAHARNMQNKMEKLNIICPKCKSNEWHTSLFKECGIICFICGHNFQFPENFDDEFPYNKEVDKEREEYGYDKLQLDKEIKEKKEKEWIEFIKNDIKKSEEKYLSMHSEDNLEI